MIVKHFKIRNFAVTTACVLFCNIAFAQLVPQLGQWYSKAQGNQIIRGLDPLMKSRYYSNPEITTNMRFCSIPNQYFYTQFNPNMDDPDNCRIMWTLEAYSWLGENTTMLSYPAVVPTAGPNGVKMFIFENGYVQTVSTTYSAPTRATGAKVVAGCAKKPAGDPGTATISTIPAISENGEIDVHILGMQNALKAGFQPFAKGVNRNVGDSYAGDDLLTQEAWTDSKRFTGKFNPNPFVQAGYLGIPMVKIPLFRITGLHKLTTLSTPKTYGSRITADNAFYATYRLDDDNVGRYYYGTIATPVHSLPNLGGATNGTPVWYLKKVKMTPNQRIYYCGKANG